MDKNVRAAAKRAGVPLWKVADEIGVCEMTLQRRLRKVLPIEQETELIAIIEKLSKEDNR